MDVRSIKIFFFLMQDKRNFIKKYKAEHNPRIQFQKFKSALVQAPGVNNKVARSIDIKFDTEINRENLGLLKFKRKPVQLGFPVTITYTKLSKHHWRYHFSSFKRPSATCVSFPDR